MKIAHIAGWLTGTLLLATHALAYSPNGPVPEPTKPHIARAWTDAQVDAVVEQSLVQLSAPIDIGHEDMPASCQSLQFLRIKARSASDDAAEADMVYMMMPGILEGANAFYYIGRQMVYMAQTQRGMNIEVWGMDRRSNCLEDLTGTQAAEQARTPEQAEDTLLGYYYENKAVNGKTFEGFYKPSQVRFLEAFGLALATEDMFRVMEHMIPDRSTRQKKLFVGGHSLGGIHTSVFLAWDRDGNPSTTDDAGYNNVAGAFGLDTTLGPIYDTADAAAAMSPLDLEQLGISTDNGGSDEEDSYLATLSLMNAGLVPVTTTFQGIFTSEVLALPEAIGLLADMAPDAEHTAVRRLPQSSAMRTMLTVMHSRNLFDYFLAPDITDFRYTNEAMVGVIFDDNFTILPFISTSLGHLSGGAVVEKVNVFDYLGDAIPLLATGENSPTAFIAADAGRNIFRLGRGPLYRWAHFDEIASMDDSEYRDVTGETLYTSRASEMSDMREFTRALHYGDSNLTEWYFPTRLVLDILMAAPHSFATNHGINILHPEGAAIVPKIEFTAGEGLDFDQFGDTATDPIVGEGMNHLDPMFAVANAPAFYQNPVFNRLLDFGEMHRQP